MVHNAVNVEDFPFREDKDEMVLFLGRLHPDKAVPPGDGRSAGSRPAHRGGGK